jgi:hypothetical protein
MNFRNRSAWSTITVLTLTTPVTVAAETVAEATPAPEAAHEIIPGEGIMLNMSTKIINLVDPTGRKYIRVTIVAEFAPITQSTSLCRKRRKQLT